ncbi:DUF305 domain-containing protein [Patescibacteria group bacterium]|nr:DUF305 domain-containing protein [Patescibacteria group bacterium]
MIVEGLVALIIGAGGGYALAMNKAPEPAATTGGHMMADGTTMGGSMNGMQGEMDSMMQGLSGKTGDAFDQAFLSEMIMHHQGAVVMAEAALKDAKHQEIKDLAKNIISAQNTEIKEMQDWQKAWYGN